MKVIFKLGQRVVSKKLGLPTIGIIAGSVRANLYLRSQQWNLRKFDFENEKWNELYPSWKEKLVIYVYLDTPTKIVSREEFEKYPPYYYPSVINYSQVPLVVMTTYPIDDLELFEPTVENT